jgi:hypothetical protein
MNQTSPKSLFVMQESRRSFRGNSSNSTPCILDVGVQILSTYVDQIPSHYVWFLVLYTSTHMPYADTDQENYGPPLEVCHRSTKYEIITSCQCPRMVGEMCDWGVQFF